MTSSGALEQHRARGGAWSMPTRWDTLEWLWSAPCESEEPFYRWPAASPEASVASEAASWRRCDPGSGRWLWPGCSGCVVVYQKSPPVEATMLHATVWATSSVSRLRTWRRARVWKLQAFATFLTWQLNHRLELLVLVFSCDDVTIIAQLVTWLRRALSLPSDPSHGLTSLFYLLLTG